MDMRMTGFASGMDIDSQVRQIMQYEREPVTRLEQDILWEEQKVDAYREVNTKFDDLRDELFDTVMMRSEMNAGAVSSTNDELISAEAQRGTPDLSASITEVSQLAGAAVAVSDASLLESGARLERDEALGTHGWRESRAEAWDTGYIVRDTASADNGSVIFEGEVWDEDSIDALTVTQDGKQFNVVTEGVPEEGEVLTEVDGDALTLTFADDVSGDVSIEAAAEYKEEIFAPVDEPRTALELDRGMIDAGATEVFVDGGEALTVVTDPDAVLSADEVFIDAETGELELGAETTEEVIVQFRESYAAGSITTYNEDGEAQTLQMAVTADDTLDDVLERLNDSNLGISAFSDAFAGQLSVSREDTGSFNGAGEDIQFEGALFNDLFGLSHTTLQTDENGGLLLMNGDDELSWDFEGGTSSAGHQFEAAPPGETSYAGTLRDDEGELIAGETIVVDGEQVGRTDSDGRLIFEGLQGGANARFTINGIETERQSNTFELQEAELTLNDTFTGETVRLEGEVDTDHVAETVENFVEMYNELLDDVNERLQEDRNRDFMPLTDDQRAEMTDHEVELWEEKSSVGMLRNDRMIQSTMTQMRVAIYTPVEMDHDSDFRMLSDIGITPSRDYTERGKLEFDEAAFREAAEKDPEAVYQLFAANGDTEAEKGVGRRLRESLDGAIENISQRAGGMRGRNMNHQFTIGRGIEQMEDRQEQMETRLQRTEDRYWSTFTAMESAMMQAQQQMNAFHSQMGMWM